MSDTGRPPLAQSALGRGLETDHRGVQEAPEPLKSAPPHPADLGAPVIAAPRAGDTTGGGPASTIVDAPGRDERTATEDGPGDAAGHGDEPPTARTEADDPDGTGSDVTDSDRTATDGATTDGPITDGADHDLADPVDEPAPDPPADSADEHPPDPDQAETDDSAHLAGETDPADTPGPTEKADPTDEHDADDAADAVEGTDPGNPSDHTPDLDGATDDLTPMAARAELELRQIAGLTAGTVMELTESHYDFSESGGSTGFSVTIDENDRVVITPGGSEATVDGIGLTEPTVLGSGVLDVGTACFTIRARRPHRRLTDWLDQQALSTAPDPELKVPADLGGPSGERSGRRLRLRRKQPLERQARDGATWEFMESVRSARLDVADRRRFRHPDPTELLTRIEYEAPILGILTPDHEQFGKVGVMVADVPWLPAFDDINAIPEPIGYELQPLLSLPAVPVVADLLAGPIGVVGGRGPVLAVARHLLISLYAGSTPDLHLHVVIADDDLGDWDWAGPILDSGELDVDDGFAVVLVDGAAQYERAGFTHQDALDHHLGVVVLADSVDELPSYCGTVVQLDAAGAALHSDNTGAVTEGVPIGLRAELAARMASDLAELQARRNLR